MSSFFRNVDTRYSTPVDLPFNHGQSSIKSLKACAILVDMEQGPVTETITGPLGELFDSGSGNNYWAHGHCLYGPRYREELADKLHRAVELCDSLQSFFIMHSMGGGTGSGLGTYILGLLEDQYPNVYRFASVVFPSEDDDVVTSPYNSMLALRELTEHTDCALPIENEAVMDLCAKIDRGASSAAGFGNMSTGEEYSTRVVDGSRLTDSVDLIELEHFYKSGKGPPPTTSKLETVMMLLRNSLLYAVVCRRQRPPTLPGKPVSKCVLGVWAVDARTCGGNGYQRKYSTFTVRSAHDPLEPGRFQGGSLLSAACGAEVVAVVPVEQLLHP